VLQECDENIASVARTLQECWESVKRAWQECHRSTQECHENVGRIARVLQECYKRTSGVFTCNTCARVLQKGCGSVYM
jgi:ActR/RegA family two-component response regulator